MERIMKEEWPLIIVVPIFKLHEHEENVIETVLEKRFCRIVTVNEMQFSFMP